jgi:hypothetical protein
MEFSTTKSNSAYEISFADMNADGKTDIVIGGYGGNGISVYQNMLPLVVGVDGRVDEIPGEYCLHQNYPNPFNPVTRIQYQLPMMSRISVKVFNILGQEITTLIDEEQEAGSYSIQWNATVPSGIYFCQMRGWPSSGQGSEYISTLKMVLIH